METLSFFRSFRGWLALLAVCALIEPAMLAAQTSSHRSRHTHSADSIPAPDAKPSPSEEVAPSKSTDKDAAPPAAGAAVASIEPAEIEGFDAFPAPVRQLLTASLDLTRRNLTYTYGSADPAGGGMDCSGTIYYLLKSQGFTDVPRQASEQYSWARRKSRVYPVLSKKQDSFELEELRPGDLLFWTGTYNIDRDPPVTHTMIYLGRRKKDGHRLMVGASDGRPYDGQKRNGVSVFDFRLPAARNADAADASTAAAPDHSPDFAGYGPIPGITDLNDAAERQTAAGHEPSTSPGEHAKRDDADDSPPAKASPSPKQRSRRSAAHASPRT